MAPMAIAMSKSSTKSHRFDLITFAWEEVISFLFAAETSPFKTRASVKEVTQQISLSENRLDLCQFSWQETTATTQQVCGNATSHPAVRCMVQVSFLLNKSTATWLFTMKSNTKSSLGPKCCLKENNVSNNCGLIDWREKKILQKIKSKLFYNTRNVWNKTHTTIFEFPESHWLISLVSILGTETWWKNTNIS